MKAIAVLNNFSTSPTREEAYVPTLVDIPDSCLIRSRKPFFIPDFDTDFRAYPSIAVKINRLGKCVAPKFAPRYRSELTGAVSVRGEKTLERLRNAGLPWSEAVVFDRSLIVGDFVPMDSLPDGYRLVAECGSSTLTFSEKDLLENIDETISRVTLHNTVRQGDIILVGLTSEGIPLTAPSRLTITLVYPDGMEKSRLLSTNIR